MPSSPAAWLTLATVVGVGVGIVARVAPVGDAWLGGVLALSAVVVALAQQTLP